MRQAPVIRRRTLLAVAAATAGLCALPAFSQNAKALRIVVPYPPGGAVDATARLLAEKLPATLQGRTVMVDNRPGAGGNIAAALVAKADADGSTLLLTSNNHTINLSLYQKPGYALDDFAPIAQIGVAGFVIVAHPSTNFKTLADMLNAARAKPNSISFGTGGNGHPAHLATELLKSRAKVSMQHVPYKGSGPLTTDLIGGQLPVGVISVIAAQPFIASGQLIGLAVTTKERWPDLSKVPTVAESGFPGYEYSGWIGVLGRTGMPEAEMATLEKQLLTISATEDVRSRLHKQGIVVVPKGRAEFKTAIAHDAVLNRDLVKTIGVQID
ncbi:MAG: tripartite tricarboxylate transporter substrate binding protein [Ramlibacter sp.]|nr:tripartite tricarboxylate transporter substrate binding protein [Ramlibacter sp.]